LVHHLVVRVRLVHHLEVSGMERDGSGRGRDGHPLYGRQDAM
jgi:hypothetical protein